MFVSCLLETDVLESWFDESRRWYFPLSFRNCSSNSLGAAPQLDLFADCTFPEIVSFIDCRLIDCVACRSIAVAATLQSAAPLTSSNAATPSEPPPPVAPSVAPPDSGSRIR
jgi:hypothetical protein